MFNIFPFWIFRRKEEQKTTFRTKLQPIIAALLKKTRKIGQHTTTLRRAILTKSATSTPVGLRLCLSIKPRHWLLLLV